MSTMRRVFQELPYELPQIDLRSMLQQAESALLTYDDWLLGAVVVFSMLFLILR